MENIALQSLQNFYIIVLHVEIVHTFGTKMVAISTHYTKNQILERLFPGDSLFLPGSKLVYHANFLLMKLMILKITII